jgi:hypothetical protein
MLILMIFLMMVPVTAAVAGPAGRTGAHIMAEEEGAQQELPMDTVTIAKKGLKKVTTNAGKTYTLSKATIIVGLDGHQVSIREMLVPCDAEISYVLEQGARRAQRTL